MNALVFGPPPGLIILVLDESSEHVVVSTRRLMGSTQLGCFHLSRRAHPSQVRPFRGLGLRRRLLDVRLNECLRWLVLGSLHRGSVGSLRKNPTMTVQCTIT